MKSKAEKLLVVESGDALREHIVAVLSDAGYEVSTDYRDGMKSILAFHPDAVVLGANPPQLDCCDLLSQIKVPSILRTYAFSCYLREGLANGLGRWI